MAKALAIESQPGIAMRLFMRSPKDLVASACAFAAVTAIVANALWFQKGPHPFPMFGSALEPIASSLASSRLNPLPRPRPAEAVLKADMLSPDSRSGEPRANEARSTDAKAAEAKPVESRPLEIRPAESKAVESRPAEMKASDVKHSGRSADSKAADPLTNLVKATSGVSPNNMARPPADIPNARLDAASRHVAAVQRALTQYGYGQLKPTGTVGPDTQMAIQKFERERKLPVTGQVSDRVVRELAAVIGHPIE